MDIYKITCKTNGKIYIGKTKNTFKTRWSGHKANAKYEKNDSVFCRAIRKYGEDNFTVEKIDEATTLAELKHKEFYWINFYNSTNKEIGYNTQKGDEEDNLIITDETKYKLVESIKKTKMNGCYKKNASKIKTVYVGVYFIRAKQMWAYSISFNGRKICKKRYETDYDAAIGRDIKLLDLFDEQSALQMMNFPDNIEKYKKGEIVERERKRKIPTKRSIYFGVSYGISVKRWCSSIIYNNKRYKKGTFKSEKDAAEMTDFINISKGFGKPLNFPNIDYKDVNYTPPKTEEDKFQYPKYISSYISGGRTKYRVRFKLNKIDKYFNTLEEAINFQKTILHPKNIYHQDIHQPSIVRQLYPYLD